MSQAKTGDTVKVHYTGRLDDGTVFDSSLEKEPLEFELGQGQIIPGFEEAVNGMNPGESKNISIPAADAFGDYHDELIQEVPRQEFQTDVEPQIGQRYKIDQPGEQPLILTVTNVSADSVTLDGNHPLAGKNLNFDIKLVEIL